MSARQVSTAANAASDLALAEKHFARVPVDIKIPPGTIVV
jgi:hypothetical protein